MKVNGLVLGGGGAKGAYEIGAITALMELGYHFSVVTGTSIGAVNSLIIASGKFDILKEVWKTIDYNTIIEHEYKFKNRSLETFVKGILKGGLSLAPFEKIVRENIFYEDLINSNIKAGIVYTSPFRKYTPVDISKIEKDKLYDYLFASCGAIPFLKKRKIDNKKCYDGFYSDNLPVKLAKELGATKIIAIDVLRGFRKRVDVSDIDYMCIRPSKKLGFFLAFDNEKINGMLELGYNDVMNNKEKIIEFINK